MNYSESYILGYLTRSFGLSPDDIFKIITGNLTLDKSPEEIRDYILTNCSYKLTLLRTLYNIGIKFDELSKQLQTSEEILINNIDNFSFWFNYLDFRAKTNILWRRQVLGFLESKGVNYNKIAEILNVSISTIQNDRVIIK